MPIALLILAFLAACSSDRAPRSTAEPPAIAGIEVGRTAVGDATAAIERLAVECVDASLMAAMQKAHAGTAMPARNGTMPEGHARYLQDPKLAQARISCEGVPLDQLEPGRPVGIRARVLIVAERSDAPVSLIALQRTHLDAEAAAADARAMFGALERQLGKPDERQGAIPAAGERLGRMRIVQRAWTRGGVVVEATAVDLGATGISVSEEVRRSGPP